MFVYPFFYISIKNFTPGKRSFLLWLSLLCRMCSCLWILFITFTWLQVRDIEALHIILCHMSHHLISYVTSSWLQVRDIEALQQERDYQVKLLAQTRYFVFLFSTTELWISSAFEKKRPDAYGKRAKEVWCMWQKRPELWISSAFEKKRPDAYGKRGLMYMTKEQKRSDVCGKRGLSFESLLPLSLHLFFVCCKLSLSLSLAFSLSLSLSLSRFLSLSLSLSLFLSFSLSPSLTHTQHEDSVANYYGMYSLAIECVLLL